MISYDDAEKAGVLVRTYRVFLYQRDSLKTQLADLADEVHLSVSLIGTSKKDKKENLGKLQVATDLRGPHRITAIQGVIRAIQDSMDEIAAQLREMGIAND